MLSVVIPVFNNNEQLSLTLESLSRQTLDQDLFEVYVVDDGSTDKAEVVIENFKSKIRNLNYIYQENGGRSKARNGAKHKLNGEIVVFTDSDRIPSYTFLEYHYNFHKENEYCICVGEVKEIYFSNITKNKDKIFKVVETDNRLAKKISVHKVLYSIYNDAGNTDSTIPWVTTFSGNMSLPKYILDDEIGWFDENFTDWGFEHFELGYRLFKAGVKFKFEKKAVNYHLAHSRESGSLMAAMERSHKYFYEKHPDNSIKYLLEFMKGQISIQELECIASNGRKVLEENEKLYLNIVN
ncbi:glycosyltransferase family 2 protein [Cytobacillus oceanisediminis]|uniref:glycosyltransferase family 2 protein n=1 Tax=Cytobacillus oceanisediminis TaxID=665099 RepID=UPI00207B01F6|nr:glycosyltransferase [Cytobacillus oceanisediminis]USK44107.1 glycosyltransferase [Cytobacillus oceanisediminis]